MLRRGEEGVRRLRYGIERAWDRVCGMEDVLLVTL